MNVLAVGADFDIDQHSKNSAAGHLSIRLGNIGLTWGDLTMPCNHSTRGPNRTIWLGAIAMLAETAGSIAATFVLSVNARTKSI